MSLLITATRNCIQVLGHGVIAGVVLTIIVAPFALLIRAVNS